MSDAQKKAADKAFSGYEGHGGMRHKEMKHAE
jgi:hypothetical protein